MTGPALDPLVCVRCKRYHVEHTDERRTECPRGFLGPDLRPEHEYEAAARRATDDLYRHAAIRRSNADAAVKRSKKLGPALPEQTYEQAMQGIPGMDYLPHTACEQCGRMVYFNGRRMVDPVHDANRHTVARSTPRKGSDDDVMTRARRARRSAGDDED